MITFFNFILKAIFVLKIFKFFSWLFDHEEKATWLEIYKIYNVTVWLINNYNKHIVQYSTKLR